MSNKVSIFNGLVEGEWSDHVSSSQRGAWATCRLKAAATGAAHLRIPGRSLGSKGRMAGKLFHEVIAMHYRAAVADRSRDKLHEWLDVLVDPEFDEVHHDAIIRTHQMLDQFSRRYGSDDIVPLAVEHQLKVPLGDGLPYYLGYADMVYMRDGIVVVEDWKTSLSAINPTAYTVFSDQGRDYLWAVAETGKWRGEDGEVLPVSMNWMFVTPGSCRRVAIPVVPATDVGDTLRVLALEQRTLPLVPTYGNHCMWCDIRKLCEAHLTGASVAAALLDYTQEDDDGSS